MVKVFLFPSFLLFNVSHVHKAVFYFSFAAVPTSPFYVSRDLNLSEVFTFYLVSTYWSCLPLSSVPALNSLSTDDLLCFLSGSFPKKSKCKVV